MNMDRRLFLAQSMAVAVAPHAAAHAATVGATNAGLLERMRWLNEPAAVRREGERLVVRSKPKTDFWRKTFYGYVTDNGHFLHLPARGEFTFSARVNGKYAALYDQAGLMVRLDEQHWMKCGSELVEGKRWASVVFTRDFSDWSTLEDLSQSEAVWWRVIRKKDSIEAHCSKDGQKFIAVRQGYFPPDVEVSVGVMCCAPEGPGFDAVFDELRLETT